MRDPPSPKQPYASGVVRPSNKCLPELDLLHGVLDPGAHIRRRHGHAGALAVAFPSALSRRAHQSVLACVSGDQRVAAGVQHDYLGDVGHDQDNMRISPPADAE